MKKCPYCAEEVKMEAIKCKHCGSNLTDDVLHQATAENPKAHEVQKVRRKGGNFEAIGFLLIVGGMIGCMVGLESGGASFGSGLVAIGFVVFIIGRFM